MTRTKSIYLALLAVLLTPFTANADPIVVGGQLTGFSGVEIDGALYDVEFVEGTCASVWTDCDEASDFFWQTEAGALAAAEALLSLLEDFDDDDPTTTFGCEDENVCNVFTVFPDLSNQKGETGVGRIIRTRNFEFDDDAGDAVDLLGANYFTAGSTTGNIRAVNGRWSASTVPEPGTLALLGLGLVGMAARRKRQRL